MQNDGSEWDITIPAFFVPQKFGRTLENQNEDVRLSIGWVVDVTYLPDIPKLELWVSSTDSLLPKEQKSLAYMLAQSADLFDFELHIQSSSCKFCSTAFKQKYCISDGKYCLVDDENGRQKLIESLQHVCLLKVEGTKSYSDFLTLYQSQCANKDG